MHAYANTHKHQLMEDEKKQEERDREKGFREMKAADEVALIPNKEPFDCPICFEPCEPGEGMVLRNCLHEFCKCVCVSVSVSVCVLCM